MDNQTGGAYEQKSFHPDKKSASEHRDHANSYRQSQKPGIPTPAPVEAPEAGAEYPKSVMCGDGVKRIAHHAEHEAQLKAIGEEPKPEEPKEDSEPEGEVHAD